MKGEFRPSRRTGLDDDAPENADRGAAARRAGVGPDAGKTAGCDGAEVYYALDMGFFKKAGLDVEITTLNNGGIISAGVASGTFDVAQAAVSSVASAHERGVNFVIIAPAALWTSDRPTSALVVAKN